MTGNPNHPSKFTEQQGRKHNPPLLGKRNQHTRELLNQDFFPPCLEHVVVDWWASRNMATSAGDRWLALFRERRAGPGGSKTTMPSDSHYHHHSTDRPAWWVPAGRPALDRRERERPAGSVPWRPAFSVLTTNLVDQLPAPLGN